MEPQNNGGVLFQDFGRVPCGSQHALHSNGHHGGRQETIALVTSWIWSTEIVAFGSVTDVALENAKPGARNANHGALPFFLDIRRPP